MVKGGEAVSAHDLKLVPLDLEGDDTSLESKSSVYANDDFLGGGGFGSRKVCLTGEDDRRGGLRGDDDRGGNDGTWDIAAASAFRGDGSG